MSEHRHFTVESTPAPADASQKDWCPFEDEGDVDLPDRSFVREDLRAEKARDDEISQRHFDEAWRLTNEMPDLVEYGWRARAVYAEHGHQLALRQWGELSTRVSAWQETARSLEKQLEAVHRASQAAPAPSDPTRADVAVARAYHNLEHGDEFTAADLRAILDENQALRDRAEAAERKLAWKEESRVFWVGAAEQAERALNEARTTIRALRRAAPTEGEAQPLDVSTRSVLDRAERIVAGQSQQEQRAAEIFLRPTEREA
ncbi:hypothetical protein [Paracoccus marcusii]|uniref:hypothetical protein n=1 Tax=Paracoccus marcusii TaxID=59779 RepID=UPI00248F5C2F|nr:hypothetical protein [Paracoccus marcusii]